MVCGYTEDKGNERFKQHQLSLENRNLRKRTGVSVQGGVMNNTFRAQPERAQKKITLGRG